MDDFVSKSQNWIRRSECWSDDKYRSQVFLMQNIRNIWKRRICRKIMVPKIRLIIYILVLFRNNVKQFNVYSSNNIHGSANISIQAIIFPFEPTMLAQQQQLICNISKFDQNYRIFMLFPNFEWISVEEINIWLRNLLHHFVQFSAGNGR